MGEVPRLIGLSQDGSLVPLAAVGMAVWVVMSIQALKKDVKGLADDHKRLEKLIGDLAVKVDGIAAQLGGRVASVEGKLDLLISLQRPRN